MDFYEVQVFFFLKYSGKKVLSYLKIKILLAAFGPILLN